MFGRLESIASESKCAQLQRRPRANHHRRTESSDTTTTTMTVTSGNERTNERTSERRPALVSRWFDVWLAVPSLARLKTLSFVSNCARLERTDDERKREFWALVVAYSQSIASERRRFQEL